MLHARIIDDEGDGVQAVGRADGRLALLRFEHLVGVAVVCRDEHDVAQTLACLDDAADALVDVLHGPHDGLNVAGVADHVAVREVAAQEIIFAGLHGLDHAVGDLL